MRALKWLFAVALVFALGAAFWRPPADAPTPVAQISNDDAGDERATTSFDRAYVRKRAAIAVHPARGADRAHIAAQLRAAATASGTGTLKDATFAVFDQEMLNYLVPEMTFVLDEGVPVERGEALIRDHQPADVAFALVEGVVVHDVTFAVIPAGVTPAAARDAQDREGILTDSLGRYTTSVQRSGLCVRYFGAILSDAQILAVREAMGRAAHVSADRVQVEANHPGPGVDLSNGVPSLEDAPHHHG